MTDKIKTLLNVAFFVGCFGLAASSFLPTVQSRLAADNFECAFEAVSTDNAFSFGNLKRPIKSITLTGVIEDPFEEVLYRFAGNAVITDGAGTFEATARGSVFLDDRGEPLGITITLKNDRFGQEGLTIATLGDDGRLDYDAAKAYLYSDQSRGDPFRLTYPANMRCRSLEN